MNKILLCCLATGVGFISGYAFAKAKLQKEFDERMNKEWEEIREYEKEKKGDVTKNYKEFYESDEIDKTGAAGRPRTSDTKEYRRYRECYDDPVKQEHPEDDIEEEEPKKKGFRGPYVATLEETADVSYDEYFYTYFEKDDTLMNEQEEVVNDPEDCIGEEALRILRETDQTIVHVINDEEYAYYEISRDYGSYEKFIQGGE